MAASGRKRPSAGYDLNFSSKPPQKLVCHFCKLVAREAHTTACCGGTLYCKTCIDAVGECADCESEAKGVPDSKSDRKIKLLKASCLNEKNGCLWSGFVEDLDEHVAACSLAEIPCPNHCKETIFRCDVVDHLRSKCPSRQYTCAACKESGIYEEMSTVHKQSCPDAEVSCPNGCGAQFLRRHVDNHRTICLLEPTECPFAEVGCKARPTVKEKQKHEREAAMEHARLAVRIARARNTDILSLRERVLDLTTVVAPATFRMADFEDHRAGGVRWTSPPFYTWAGGYRLTLSIDAAGFRDGANTHVSLFAYLMRGKYDAQLHWPFESVLEVRLLNQLEDANHIRTLIDFKAAAGDAGLRVDKDGEDVSEFGYGKTRLAAYADLPLDTDRGTHYLALDSLYFRVGVHCEKPWLVCEKEISV